MVELYIDIETIPSRRKDLEQRLDAKIKPPGTIKKQESIATWYAENREEKLSEALDKTALDGSYGEVISIAWALGDGHVKCMYRKLHESEMNLLLDVFDVITLELNNFKITKWIGHNIVNFDLPFLHKRFIVNGIYPFALPFNAKPWDDIYFDTMTSWSGLRDYISLDELCFVLNLEGKAGSGKDVWPLVQSGNYEKLVEYNKSDVELVRNVYRRMNLISR